MTTLAMLWLPILLSAVFVFVASSVLHMALPMHKGDYKKLPNEDDVRTALRNAKIPPGQYMFPNADSMKHYASDEMVAKFREGPVGMLVMRPNGPGDMGKSLGQWFAFTILISVFVAYLSGLALAPGADGAFRVTATAALLGYGFSEFSSSIWKSVPWSIAFKFFVDGFIYALITGATFAWLWPAAA